MLLLLLLVLLGDVLTEDEARVDDRWRVLASNCCDVRAGVFLVNEAVRDGVLNVSDVIVARFFA